ncbi:MAG: hypothetical protein ACSHW1_09130 [Yoonia sp.]|uniref:hypothetical protein n=1 Tax=Yoonia sp. TaxID=2212373 RepID=UPI003EF71E61
MRAPDNQNFAPTAKNAKLSDRDVALRRILRNAPQDLWLDTIRRTTGDRHNTLIYWMLSQPECDFAVAAHAFYRCNPASYLQDPAPLATRPGPAQIFAVVLKNWEIGYYRTHNLRLEALDIDPDLQKRLHDELKAQSALPFTIPQEILYPAASGKLVRLSSSQSPNDAPHLWPLYAKLGLQVSDTAPGLKRRVAQAKGFLKRVGIR